MNDTFDNIHAAEQLKRKTKATLRKKTFDYGRDIQRRQNARMRLAGYLLSLTIILSGIGVIYTPVSFIDIDINPSIEVTVNLLGRVISVNGLNEDGRKLVEDTNVDGMPYIEAMQRILICDSLDPYLKDNSTISITVSGKNSEKTEQMLEKVVCCAYSVADEDCIFYGQANPEDVRQARALGLSVARYQALLLLQQENDAVTVDDIHALSTQDIWTLLHFQKLENPCGRK